MASSKEDGAAVAAAEQLGSISLGDSEESKDNETEPTANETPTKFCSACGKKSDALMKCRACKCVWYCDKKCQNRHWKEHKKECRRIKKILDSRGGKLDVGSELDIGPLGKVPPREECPICMSVLPIREFLSTYAPCCGKTLCGGCEYMHQMKSSGELTCAFCREPISRSDEERLARLGKRVKLKDPYALQNLGLLYCTGSYGLSVNQKKGIDLLREAADLGCTVAQYQLAAFHHNGEMSLEENKEEALKYFTKAAEGGDVVARHNLGHVQKNNGDFVSAMRCWRLSASGGIRRSMEDLIDYFEGGVLHHGDLTETMQAMYRSKAEMRSDARGKYIAYLKMTGEYEDDADY